MQGVETRQYAALGVGQVTLMLIGALSSGLGWMSPSRRSESVILQDLRYTER